MYNQLVALERRIDSVAQRKRAALSAALFTPETAQRKIRLYLFNTHSSQQPAAAGPSGAACLRAPHRPCRAAILKHFLCIGAPNVKPCVRKLRRTYGSAYACSQCTARRATCAA